MIPEVFIKKHPEHHTEEVEHEGNTYYVCHNCQVADTACEVWSRCVGYLRPTKNWNKGKKSEWRNRVTYKVNSGRK